jgi:Peptidase of plants and bacteria
VLLAGLRQRFAGLRAMRVAGWEESLAGPPVRIGEGAERQWRAGVRLGYCFVVAGCPPSRILVETRWAVRGGTLRLVFFGASYPGELGPRPWEISDLRAAVGDRVIVAAPARYAGRLPTALAAAELAAAVADRYSVWAPPPGRYLVFLAGPDEWRRWYGLRQPTWVAGYAMPVDDDATEIILNAQKVTGAEVLDTLRHELTHVVTLAGVRRSYTDRWWLVEGIAEYVRMAGRPLSAYRGMTLTRRYVLSGGWSGEVTLDGPAQGATAVEASGRYGVALLAVRRLAERFGEARLLAFFDAVVRRGMDEDRAAQTQLGVPLDDLVGDCANYVRRMTS